MKSRRVLVTGSSGHLGEALVRTLRNLKSYDVVSVDLLPSPYTTHVGSITDRAFVKQCMEGVQTVYHTATLHKPHVATHSRQAFVDTNITGTLNLLEEAAAAQTPSGKRSVESFIFTSTTSVFGDALVPQQGAPAVWITEEVTPIPKNIYGATKAAAEDMCQLSARNKGLPTLVLRTSRFFPEEDDKKEIREQFSDDNMKANEFLNRRVDIEDIVDAHLLAAQHAPRIGFRKYIISATTPFVRDDLPQLTLDASRVVQHRVPEYEEVYKQLGWKITPTIGRVYINARAREELGWKPRHDFKHLMQRLKNGEGILSPLAKVIGSKGYHHTNRFDTGPYPIEQDH